MTGHGIRHTQLNLSNAGLPTLPEVVSDEDLERIRRLTKAHGVHLDALSGTFNMIDPDEEARRKRERLSETLDSLRERGLLR